jgi:hypothetical protein
MSSGRNRAGLSQRRKGRQSSRSPRRATSPDGAEIPSDDGGDPDESLFKFLADMPTEGIQLMLALCFTFSGLFSFFFWLASSSEGIHDQT